MSLGLLFSRYTLRAIMPYFFSAWLLLSVVLFVQQASRFSDIFFSANIPSSLIWQLTLSLIPSVISFTCPMAVLVGVLIGISKMASDNELIAIRAAGSGSVRLMLPIIVLGIALSIFSFYVNLSGVPFAARVVRQVATQTAIYKLESPIEPGIFNTEVAGYTIYIKDGDVENGTWKKIFVYSEDEKAGKVRLITSTNGRIDSSDEKSELILENAVSSELSRSEKGEKLVSENIGEVRYSIKTRRGELIEKLGASELTPDELGLSDLAEYARNKEGKERTEALILWQRRILLSITPLIFALLGGIIALRFWRKGRGFAIFSALITLIAYYLASFFGEQMVRSGALNQYVGGAIPLVFSILAMLYFAYLPKFTFLQNIFASFKDRWSRLSLPKPKRRIEDLLVNIKTGLRDIDLLFNLAKYYLLSLTFLAAVFVIFTAFELWRFAGSIEGGVSLLLKYIFYLLPFIYLQLAPSSAMVAVLATYVIKSRQNEIITWTAAGQSIYRILLPCMIAAFLLGIFNYQVQERIMPQANQRQDELRTLLRSRGSTAEQNNKLWVADSRRIFSFRLNKAASDNAKQVQDLQVFEFDNDSTRLKTVYRAPAAIWDRDKIFFNEGYQRFDLSRTDVRTSSLAGGELDQASNPFLQARKKPSHLTGAEIRFQIDTSESEVERRAFAVALEKRYATLVLPFVIALFTAPFALSITRQGKAAMAGYAIGLWLAFMGISGAFEQLGTSGALQTGVAVWGPLIFFAMVGIYLLSRVRT